MDWPRGLLLLKSRGVGLVVFKKVLSHGLIPVLQCLGNQSVELEHV